MRQSLPTPFPEPLSLKLDAIFAARAERLAIPLSGGQTAGTETNALLVHLGSEVYAIEIRYLSEILTGTPCTKLPGALAAIEGIVSFRGRVMPVVDLAALIGSSVGSGPETREGPKPILVLSSATRTVGLSIEAVGAIIAIPVQTEGHRPKSTDGIATQFTRLAQAGGPWVIRMDLLFSHPVMKSVLTAL